MSSRSARGVPWNLIVVGAVGIVVLAGFLVMRARAQEPSADPSTAGASSGALEALLEAPSPSAGLGDTDPTKGAILSKTSLHDAIATARPMMSNTVGRLDMGSALLAVWASKNLSWQALESLPETSPALFKKDPDAERGRRFCMSGTILEIRAEKTLASRLVEDRALPLIDRPSSGSNPAPSDTGYAHADPASSAGAAPSAMADALLVQGMDLTIPDDGKVYIATIQSKPDPASDGNNKSKTPRDSIFVEIIAVKSSGALVDGSETRVCGILTGVTVPPAGVNTTAAIDAATVHRIVGMFDLPQNHTSSGLDVTAQHG